VSSRRCRPHSPQSHASCGRSVQVHIQPIVSAVRFQPLYAPARARARRRLILADLVDSEAERHPGSPPCCRVVAACTAPRVVTMWIRAGYVQFTLPGVLGAVPAALRLPALRGA
jgi:hypothetical protein